MKHNNLSFPDHVNLNNPDRSFIGYLKKKFLTNKFEMLREIVKENLYIFLTSELRGKSRYIFSVRSICDKWEQGLKSLNYDIQ